MRWTSVARMALVVVVGFALVPTTALGQSVVSGQVTDNTGGVLPGVTVEAASPALIGGSRLAVSDGQGRYAIIDLEPGPYSVTFRLPGFSTVVREGIDLPANFTATVDVELEVGALEETITVSGASPIVDVQQAQAHGGARPQRTGLDCDRPQHVDASHARRGRHDDRGGRRRLELRIGPGCWRRTGPTPPT